MRLRVIACLLATGILQASAQPQQAPAGPVDVTLSATDQTEILGLCVLALRSPAVTAMGDIIELGGVCARLRAMFAEAQKKAAAAAQPKE